jgi:acyl carrier protein
VNWGKLFQVDAAAALSPLLSEQVRNATTFVTRAQEEPELLKQLRELPPSERHEALTAFLSELLGKALKLKNRELLAPRQGLFELGLDSIIALQLKSQLELSLGQPFPATLFFTYPTIESLANYLSSDLRLSEAETQSQTAALETPEAESESTSTDALSEEEIAQLITQEIGYGKEIVSAAGKPPDHAGRR